MHFSAFFVGALTLFVKLATASPAPPPVWGEKAVKINGGQVQCNDPPKDQAADAQQIVQALNSLSTKGDVKVNQDTCVSVARHQGAGIEVCYVEGSQKDLRLHRNDIRQGALDIVNVS